MAASLCLWSAFVLSLGILLWFCRPRAGSLLIWAVSAICLLPASFLPIGTPDFRTPPPGKYTVIGADIRVDEAIYALLSKPEWAEPHHYRLPYTTGQANQLQDAIDASQGQQGGVEAELSDGGEMAFHGPSVQEDQPKQSEQPAFEVP